MREEVSCLGCGTTFEIKLYVPPPSNGGFSNHCPTCSEGFRYGESQKRRNERVRCKNFRRGLDQDIARLEEMASKVDHTGINYSLVELSAEVKRITTALNYEIERKGLKE